MQGKLTANQTHKQTLSATVPVYTDAQVKYNITMERLRQARYSFNLALFAAAASVCVSLVGAGLMLSGAVPQGTITAAVGMVASLRCSQLAKDANDRLDRF